VSLLRILDVLVLLIVSEEVQTSPVLVNIKNQRLPAMRDLMNTAIPSLERLTQDIETRLKAIC